MPSRRYTLSLSPQLIYCRSNLLPTLISSKVYRQLEFQAVGSWWIHRSQADSSGDANLYRVPGSREDVFADDKITVKSKRTLMRFLRHIGKTQHDNEPPLGPEEDESRGTPFSTYLESKFQVPAELLDPLLSLSLSQASPQKTSAAYAVPRIQRHLASIGVFGPGFGSLLAKWGGGSEICQVGCRALAVGGGIYVLNSGVESIGQPAQGEHDARLKVQLSNGEAISTKHVFGSHWDLPTDKHPQCDRVARSISIVSSPLEGLFPVAAEGAPTPAGAVVVFPGSSLGQADDAPPVYVLVHSSETGECPPGQCKFSLFLLYFVQESPIPQSRAHMMTTSQKLLIYIACTFIDEKSNLIMSFKHFFPSFCRWSVVPQLTYSQVSYTAALAFRVKQDSR